VKSESASRTRRGRDDDQELAQRDNLLVQHLVLMVGCCLILLAALEGSLRLLVVAGMASVEVAAVLVIRRVVIKDRLATLLLVEHSMAVVVGLFLPQAYVGASIIAVGSIGANAGYLNRVRLAALAMITSIGIIATPLVHDVDNALIVVLGSILIVAHSVLTKGGGVVSAEGAERAARFQADHDFLTSLPNRRALRTELDALRADAEVGLLLFDIDNFKEINDTLGHEVGDLVLCVVAERIAALDESVFVARLGGDEFAAIVPGPVDRSSKFASLVASSWGESTTVRDIEISTRTSIGIAHTSGVEISGLLRYADIAMYRAKREGLGAVWYRTEDDPHSQRRLRLVQELPEALAFGDVQPWYQPQIEVSTGRVVGGEALARWVHPEFGVVSAAELLEHVALAGLHRELTSTILEQAVDEAGSWPDHIGLSINITVDDVQRKGFLGELSALLEATGFDPRRLTLELVEDGGAVRDSAQLGEQIVTLRALGVSVSLDDFGQASSSLARLDLFDVDELKIDRQFISRMLDHHRDAAIIESVVDLARRLELRIVAEGVETGDSAQAIADAGITIAQGYHYGRPTRHLHVESFDRVLPRLGPSASMSIRPADLAVRQ
jgi:diguanylate cyclase